MTKILIDAYDLSRFRGKSIGIYNYTRNVLTALSGLAPANAEISVLCSEENQEDFLSGRCNLLPVVVGTGGISAKDKLAWDLRGCAQFIREKKLAVDVYFNPRGFLPLGVRRQVGKTVITIHDLIPWYYADKVSGRAWLENRFICRRLHASITGADTVLTISNFSKLEITQRTGRSDISVAYNGVSFHRDTQTPPFGARADRTHLLAMASTLHHKNLAGIVNGYVAYCRRCQKTGRAPLPLVICGVSDLGVLAAAVPETLRPSIRLCKGISDAELAQLYASARAFIFLSFIEGFGLPPFEALVHGTPTIVSDIPVFQEVLGDAVRYAQPSEPEDLARVLEATLDDPTLVDADAMRVQLSQCYSWADHARKLIALFTASQASRT
jgi:glycosyltransferase involved in cell wall biosynthesis